jgi:cell division protein FtsL
MTDTDTVTISRPIAKLLLNTVLATCLVCVAGTHNLRECIAELKRALGEK